MASNNYRRRHRRRNARSGLFDLLRLVFMVAALTVAVILVIRLFVNRTPSASAFVDGVYVNGVSLGGMGYDEGLNAVMDGLDKRLNQDTYVLTYGDKQWPFTPSKLKARLETDLEAQLQLAWNLGHTGTAREQREQADVIKANPVYYDSAIVYDEASLEEFLYDIKAQIDIPPVEATVSLGAGEQIKIIPSVDGLTLSIEDLRSTLDQAIREGTTAQIELKPKVQKPVHSTEDLLANTKLIGEHTTSTKDSSSLRTKNIIRALSAFNGIAIQPGTVVSFNEVVGKRTKANGFFKAPEFDGTTVIDGIGGGACQASTTLYCALLKANVDVSLRSTHNMTVSYIDPSLDAAVSDDGKDLRFTNNLDYPIYIFANANSVEATVHIYGPPNKYEIGLTYEIVDQKRPQRGRYVRDETGKYVTYTDQRKLIEAGKDMVKSKGYRVYYDRETGAEVEREFLSLDTYYEKQPVYWRGILERGFEG